MRKQLLSIIVLIIIAIFTVGCSSAEHFYKEGKKSFKHGKYEAAAESFDKAIKANPNRAEYHIDYGMTLIALGKYKEALSQFKDVYVSKDMSIIKENNKRALRGSGIAYYDRKEYKKAVKEFDKALNINELSDLNVDILYYKGSSLRIIGSYQEAIDTYTKILTRDKRNALAYADRAFCYQCIGSYKEGLDDYDKAIKLDSDNFEWYFGKYRLLFSQGDEVGANNVLTEAGKIKVKTVEDKYNQAKLHFYQENYEKAVKELEESLSAGFSEAYYYIGEIYRIKKDNKKAVDYYENYIKMGKVLTPNVYNQLAVCLMKQQEYKKAIKFLKKGMEFNHSETLQTFKKNEIIAYEKLGDFDIAKKKLKSYLKNYPKDKNATQEAEFINSRLMKSVTK